MTTDSGTSQIACPKCGQKIEQAAGLKADALVTCPTCGHGFHPDGKATEKIAHELGDAAAALGSFGKHR